jgi:hypothetical protein
MPAVSQQQQKLFGLALSVKRGETPRSEASDDVLNIVDTMSEKDIEDFAGTEHKGLPSKVESQLRSIVREILKEKAIKELLEQTPKIKNTISKKEWSKIAKFNKHIGIDGTHYSMKYDDKIGTYLQAVTIEN